MVPFAIYWFKSDHKNVAHVLYVISAIANTAASIMLIIYNSLSKIYCETMYPHINTKFATFNCEGTDLQSCINDNRCYNVNTFGSGYCTDHCQCCQQKVINDTSITSIVFLCLTAILLICLIYSNYSIKKPLHTMNGLLVITNLVYAILSVVVIIHMDVYSTAIWIIVLIINLLTLIYVVWWYAFVEDETQLEAASSKQSNTNAITKLPENPNHNQIQIQPNVPPADYNDLPPYYDDINKRSGLQEIRIWFKQTMDLPTDYIDYNYKYCEMLIENGFDTWKAIKCISNDNLMEIGINKLGHRKQIMLAIKELSSSNEGQKEIITNI